MTVRKAEFVTSVADIANYPDTDLPEITFVGRSNVGKSSLINFLAGTKSLARTSSTPGRTRLINLFRLNDAFLLVDLPGYGYQAGGSKREANAWSALIGTYLQYGMRLKHAFVLLDVRHAPSELDRKMLAYLDYLRIPFTVIATKCDTVPRSRLRERLSALDAVCGVGVDAILPVSATKGIGKDAVLDRIEAALAV